VAVHICMSEYWYLIQEGTVLTLC